MIRWTSDRGFSGTVRLYAPSGGSRQWEIQPLALLPGLNQIMIQASDDLSTSVSLQMRITLRQSPDPSPPNGNTPETVPPHVTVLSPNTTYLVTRNSSVTLRGLATHNTAIELVRWECSCGLSGRAAGTQSWVIANLALPIGPSEIRVYARDPAGNEGMAKIVAHRYVD